LPGDGPIFRRAIWWTDLINANRKNTNDSRLRFLPYINSDHVAAEFAASGSLAIFAAIRRASSGVVSSWLRKRPKALAFVLQKFHVAERFLLGQFTLHLVPQAYR
jgi:hypothetical protein